MNHLQLINRQKKRRIDARQFRKLARKLLEDLLDLPGYELAVHFVNSAAMARVNEQFLQHAGSTDVITFDYTEGYPELKSEASIRGEIYISVDDAVKQALDFGVTWQDEILRYFIHGVLHLLGYDDLQPAPRKIMKQQERKLLKLLLAPPRNRDL